MGLHHVSCATGTGKCIARALWGLGQWTATSVCWVALNTHGSIVSPAVALVTQPEGFNSPSLLMRRRLALLDRAASQAPEIGGAAQGIDEDMEAAALQCLPADSRQRLEAALRDAAPVSDQLPELTLGLGELDLAERRYGAMSSRALLGNVWPAKPAQPWARVPYPLTLGGRFSKVVEQGRKAGMQARCTQGPACVCS